MDVQDDDDLIDAEDCDHEDVSVVSFDIDYARTYVDAIDIKIRCNDCGKHFSGVVKEDDKEEETK